MKAFASKFRAQLKRRPLLRAACATLLVLYGMALGAEFISPYAPDRMFRELANQPPSLPARVSLFAAGDRYEWLGIIPGDRHLFRVPEGCFLLGSDQFGRDQLSRLIHGSRISLSVGLIGVAISFAFGLAIGGVAGYCGGRTDMVIMRLCEVIISFPALYLILALRGIFPMTMSSAEVYLMVVVVLSFVGWAGLARIIRGLVLALKEEPFIRGALAIGASPARIIFRHLLPHTMSFTVVAMTLSVPGYIIGESALSVIGLGIQEPQASWGNMLNAARSVQVLASYPWLLLPGFFIVLTVMSFNFLGDGLRDVLDPYEKGVRR